MALSYNNSWSKCVLIVLFGVLMHVCDSYVLIQGDMMIEPPLESIQTAQIKNVRSKRNAVVDKKRIWDFGVIPYEIDTTAGYDHIKIAKIKEAMRHWENYTCIIFIERNAAEHADFIRFTNTECDCCSYVGKIGGGQYVTVDKCEDGDITHELGHVIGFYHEHQRPDRDEYIEIKRDNYEGDDSIFNENFEKFSPDDVDTLNEPYDFQSIMHYAQETGSQLYTFKKLFQIFGYIPDNFKNIYSIILPKKKIVSKIDDNKKLSKIDIRKTSKLYKCPKCGQTYFDQEATFTSPEYYIYKLLNKSTNRKFQCTWRITVTDGIRIRLNIDNLDIFKSINCESDYLEVYDGYWNKSTLLGRFCGSSTPKFIISTSNHMIINYISSHSEHRGFAANYETFFTY